MQQVIRKVVIAGGGTAGWCAAAALSQVLGPVLDITLIESAHIGIVGVGEATIPTIVTFHKLLGIDEREFLRETNGTIKLGIKFEDWARKGDRYIHSFGVIGKSTWLAPFHHLWLQARAQGFGGDLSDYCIELQAAERGKFFGTDKSGLGFAYHFDASLYGKFLRKFSEKRGVKRIEGDIVRVEQNDLTGDIKALHLQSGERIEGDLFIDCTGFRGLLIEQTLKTGYESWDEWLPMDRAWATQVPTDEAIHPYVRAGAHEAGWWWRIPLQHRVGHGFVFSSAHLSEDEALHNFRKMFKNAPLIEPFLLKFQGGQRKKSWNKNCVSLGLAGGFLEPLESTSIHLMQIALTRLLQLFPTSGISEAVINRYNATSRSEYERARDFVILHYKLTERDDTEFWRSRRAMAVPDLLANRIRMFRESGHAYQEVDELFRLDSWVQVCLGQRLEPQGAHPFGLLMTREQMTGALDGIRRHVKTAVDAMPSHEEFIRRYCAIEAA